MKKTIINILMIAVTLSLTSACAYTTTKADYVRLQHPLYRTVIECYKEPFKSAERCAFEHEARGYVRLTDKTKMPASNDVLNHSTYPSRRWRETEKAPRW